MTVGDVADDWERSQSEELLVWERTVASVPFVLAEISEAAAMHEFGCSHGLDRAENVIELGIGPMGIGWASFAAATKAVGVDSLPQLSIKTGDPVVDEFARELQSRTTYVQADATERLPFDSAMFDVVVCDNVVDHAQDPRAILREASRLLRPSGRLLFGVNVFSLAGITKWRQVTRRFHPNDANVVCHPHSFTIESAQAMLDQLDFDVLVATEVSTAQRLLGHAFRLRALARPRPSHAPPS